MKNKKIRNVMRHIALFIFVTVLAPLILAVGVVGLLFGIVNWLFNSKTLIKSIIDSIPTL